MPFTPEHDELRRSLQKFIAAEINPHVDEWEEAEIFPAHEVFKKMGDLGFLGLTKPEDYGGQALDYSYAMVMAEELGHITCGGVPMAIGVQTDMATPALARFGSDEVQARIPGAVDRRRLRRLPRRLRGRRRLRRRLDQDHGAQGRRATTSSTAARCGPPTAPRPTGCASSPTRPTVRCTGTNR